MRDYGVSNISNRGESARAKYSNVSSSILCTTSNQVRIALSTIKRIQQCGLNRGRLRPCVGSGTGVGSEMLKGSRHAVTDTQDLDGSVYKILNDSIQYHNNDNINNIYHPKEEQQQRQPSSEIEDSS